MKIIYILLLSSYSIGLFAQADSTSRLHATGLLMGNNQIKEQNLHAKVHSGALYAWSYRYEKTTNTAISGIDVGLCYSKLKTHYEEAAKSMNIQLIGTYKYLVKAQQHATSIYYIGPFVSVDYSLSYYPNWDDSHLYWADGISAGLSNRVVYSLKKQGSLAFDFSLSVFSLTSRPLANRDYKIDDVSVLGIAESMHSNLKLNTVNQTAMLHLQSAYTIRITDKLSEAFVYSLSMKRMTNQVSEVYANVIHSFGIMAYF